MKRKHFALIGITILSVIVLSSVALANSSSAKQPPTLPEMVRQATVQFKDTTKLDKAGYALLHGCVSGPQDGAMDIQTDRLSPLPTEAREIIIETWETGAKKAANYLIDTQQVGYRREDTMPMRQLPSLLELC